MKQIRPFCLSSTSPRRREMLALYGFTFAVYSPQVLEEHLPGETPQAFVTRMAGLKAEDAQQAFPEHLILGGDTVVTVDSRVLGKPVHQDDAERMLAELSGRTHQVISAFTVLNGRGGERIAGTVRTEVTFRSLTPAWIHWYAGLGEGADKAGAYGIQGVGGAMVQSINGSYNNVVGFPIEEIVWKLLEKQWVTL